MLALRTYAVARFLVDVGRIDAARAYLQIGPHAGDRADAALLEGLGG